jgi:hypothetical protein
MSKVDGQDLEPNKTLMTYNNMTIIIIIVINATPFTTTPFSFSICLYL